MSPSLVSAAWDEPAPRIDWRETYKLRSSDRDRPHGSRDGDSRLKVHVMPP